MQLINYIFSVSSEANSFRLVLMSLQHEITLFSRISRSNCFKCWEHSKLICYDLLEFSKPNCSPSQIEHSKHKFHWSDRRYVPFKSSVSWFWCTKFPIKTLLRDFLSRDFKVKVHLLVGTSLHSLRSILLKVFIHCKVN